MKITKAHINKVIKNGNWIIRTDNDGISYGGFKWPEVGEWIEAPDWNDEPICSNGLFGQDKYFNGYCKSGNRVVFCETEGRHIAVDNEKVKVKKARIIYIGIPPQLTFFGGSLNVSGCDLRGVTLPEKIGGSLDVSGCDLKGVTLPKEIGGWLYVRECDLKGVTLPKEWVARGVV